MAILDQYIDEYLKTQQARGGLDKRYHAATGDQAKNQASAVFNQFSSLFKNLVGRDPNESEFGQFHQQILSSSKDYGSVLTPGAVESAGLGDVDWRNKLVQFIGDNFQGAAQDEAQHQLEGQQGEAARLADLYRGQGRKAISDTRDSLLDYQSRITQKLMPQIITRMQSLGLLNSGGLNEAIAGALGDVTAAGDEQLRQATLDNENKANDIAFSGASAPYQFKLSNITGMPDALRSSGAGAMDMAFKTYMNNLDYQHQAQLMAYQSKLQRDNQPSLLRSLGQNFVSNLGASAGKSLGSWLGPSEK